MNQPDISPQLQPLVEQIAELSHNKRSQAFDLCEATLTMARELHDDRAFVMVAQHYALLIDQRGYPDAAIDVLHEALQLAQSHHQFAEEAQLLNLIGRSLYTRAEYRRAMQAWARSLECSELAGDRLTWTYAKIGIGQIYDALNDSATAVDVLSLAAVEAEHQQDGTLILNAYLNLGVNLYRLARYAEAESAYMEVLRLSRELGHEDDEGETLFRLAELDIARNNPAAALERLEEARHLCLASSHWWGLANVCLTQGEALAIQGKVAQAVVCVREGIEYADHAGATHIAARLWHALARHAENLGDLQQAYAAFKQASELDQLILVGSHNPQQQRELEDLAGLRISPSRQLLELSTDQRLEQQPLADAMCLLAQKGCDILDLPQCSIWLMETDGQPALRCICRYEAVNQSCHAMGELLRQQALPDFFSLLRQGDSVIAHVARYHQHTWLLYEHYLAGQGIEAVLCQPLLLNGQLSGVIMFEHRQRQHNWSADELLYASQLATIATRTIANIDRQHFLEDIAKLNVALRESNDLLEDRVRARTTELETANHELAQAMNHLVQSEKIAALGNLVAGLAHELNTPLGITLVSATTLDEKQRELAAALANGTLRKSMLEHYLHEAQDAVQLIVRNSRRANDMMTNFKQVAVDTSSNQRRTFDLRATVEEVLWTLSPQYKKRPIEFHIQIPPGIMLDSYPGPFEQIINNLVINSLVHAFAPDQAGEICITARLEGNDCLLLYRDTGKGIAEALQSRVFEPFFTTRFGQGGSGLGLYLVYSLATGSLGGEVRILPSQEEAGVCFELRFPTSAPVSPQISAPQQDRDG